MAPFPNSSVANRTQEWSDPFAGSRYRALSRLGSSRGGDTYVVEHRELKKRFFAKVLRPELVGDPLVVDRMRLEAQSLGRLRHPNVVTITGFEHPPQGVPFIVMEWLRGRTLEEELWDRGALPVQEALDWTRQILSALEALHDLGVIHRDILPRNLFLHTMPSGQRVLKVLDFGSVRIHSSASARAPMPLAIPTDEGVIVGTLGFASPEAQRGQAVDPRSDLYQVGLVLYVMLTGKEPFEPGCGLVPNDLPAGKRPALAHSPITPPPANLSGSLAPAIEAVVERAVATDPDERFQSSVEFRHALDRLAITANQLPSAYSAPISEACAPQSPSLTRLFAAMPKWLKFCAISSFTGLLIVVVGLWLTRWR